MSTKGKTYRHGSHWRAWTHQMPWLDKRQARRLRRRWMKTLRRNRTGDQE